jgi:hypothetical protein
LGACSHDHGLDGIDNRLMRSESKRRSKMRSRRGSIVVTIATAMILGATAPRTFAKPSPAPAPQPSADVSVSNITDSSDPAPLAQELAYAITVRNAGPSSAHVAVEATTSGAWHMRPSAGPSQGSCYTVASISCNLGFILPGASATIIVTTRPTGLGTLTLSATALDFYSDPNTSNNQRSESTTVTAIPETS